MARDRVRARIRKEAASDAETIEAVTIAAFRNAPHTSHTEQFIIRALRHSRQLTVSLVAEDHGLVIGHVAVSPVAVSPVAVSHGAVSPVAVSSGAARWYGLGPLSVLPERQGEGIGAQLTEHALTQLRTLGAAGCVVLGEPGYYSRFGFRAEPSLVLPGVPAQYFQALSFGGSLPSGTVSYPDSFAATA